MAEKGKPLGVRATVRDAAARVESVSLFYATSRGMTPFRAAMSSSGAGVWYASIPGHMMGPGAQMFYYIQAENADGETRETDWQTVKLVEAGVAPEAIPAASAVAQQAQRADRPSRPRGSPRRPRRPRAGKSKYLLPARSSSAAASPSAGPWPSRPTTAAAGAAAGATRDQRQLRRQPTSASSRRPVERTTVCDSTGW
jgi:hypothetical protein